MHLHDQPPPIRRSEEERMPTFDAVKLASLPISVVVTLYLGALLLYVMPEQARAFEKALAEQRAAYILQLDNREKFYISVLREHNQMFQGQLKDLNDHSTAQIDTVQNRCFDSIAANRTMLVMLQNSLDAVTKKLGVWPKHEVSPE